MTENYVAGMNNASGGTVVNGDLDDASKLIICHSEEELPHVQEKKKSVSSSTEKKRKDKIRYWINKIGEQLPPVENPDKDRVGRSTLEIVEKAWSYIVQLKEAADPACRDKIQNTYVDEIKKLKNDLEYWKQQAYKLHQKLETAGNPPVTTVNQVQSAVPPATVSTIEKSASPPMGQTDNATTNKESEKSKSKTKRRNTISLQLENLKKQQQENANNMNVMQQQGNQELLAPGMMNSFPTMMDGGAAASQQQMLNQQMLMNSMIFGGGSGGVMVPNSTGGMMLTNTALGNHGNPTGMVVNGSVGGGTGISLQGNQIQGQSSDAKGQSAAEAGAGLLQLAMQDAGITPSSQSEHSEDQNVTNVSSVSMATGSNSDTQPSALHTLASIASNTQNLSNASQVPASQVQVNSLVTQGGSSAPTATTQSINSSAPIMATGQGQGGINATMSNSGSVMNMSFMNGQQMQPGNMMPNGQNPGFNPMAATQQIMFVNEQGVPCVANIPMGIDPTSLGIPSNAKQVMGIDKSGNVIVQNLQKDHSQINMNEQALLANTLAQQQMNLALQGQIPGQFQGQNNVAIGNPTALVQPSMNNQIQLNQQMMQPMGGQLPSGQLTQTNQGLILPASQTGNLLTVNSVPTQQSQLPQALLLPNGQIIPVVSNPNLVAGQQGQMASMMPPNPQQIAGGNIQQRLPLPAGMVQGDPNTQVIMTSSGQIQIGQPQMSLPAGGVVSVSSAPPTSQGLLMTTSSVVPVSPSASSTTASHSTGLLTSTSGINVTSSSVVNSSTTAPVLQGSKGQGQDGNSTSNSGPIFSSVTTSDASIVPMIPTSQMMTVTSSGDQNNTSGAPIAVLNPQLQSQLSGQLSGSTAPILLTMNCNGQATSILVDPTTMHVLGTVQTQQPAAGQNATPATSSSSTPPSKKGKKNLQRAICPKPQGNKAVGGAIPTSGATLLPAGLLVPTSAPTQGMWLTKEGEQPMDIVIPTQPTTSAPTKKAGNKSRSKTGKQKGNAENSANTGGGGTAQENAGASETDILAKAAESIFSSEISPGNFYNPANEDNPLQIDTSVCEGEEDNSVSGSPVKDCHSNKNKSKTQCVTAEGCDSEKNASEPSSVEDKDKAASKSQDNLTADPKSQEENELLEMFKDTVNSTDQLNKSADSTMASDPLEDILLELKESNAQESQKKTKKGKRNEKDKSDNFQLFAESALKEIDSVQKSIVDRVEKVKEDRRKRDQSEEKDTLIDLPESITFSATDLPDVLDQVEQLGNTLKQSPPLTNTKKSKKKGRPDNSEQEPVSKKRKKNSAKDKVSDTNPSQLTKPSNSMSVYDFEDDDFSTPLFQVSTPRLPNTTLPSGKSNAADKTPSASSQSPLYSMPILSEPTVSTPAALFEEVTTPKKRQSKQRSKKNDAKNDASLNDKSSTSAASEKTTNSVDSDVTSVKNSNYKSKDNKRSDTKSSTANDKDKSTKSNDIMDSFGFDNLHSDGEKSDSKKDSSQKDLSPLFGSSEPKSRKLDKEIEKPNLNEPLFGAFSDSHFKHKSGGIQDSDFLQQSRDSLPSITSTNPLTLDTSDIDSDVNNILGLSPRMISPTPSLGGKSKQQAQKSPQLQTPKSTSPVSRISPVPMATSSLGTTTHQSQILPMSNEQIMSHAPTTSSIMSSSSGLQYSAESLFSSHSKSLGSASSNPFSSSNVSTAENSSSNKNVETISTSGKMSEDKQSAIRPRSIYSAENFVQSSRNDITKPSTNKSVPSLGQPSSVVSPSLSSFNRNDSSDGFNFANIGHILSTPTTTSNSFIDTLTASSVITTSSSLEKSSTSTEFTFTLTNVTTTVSTTNTPLMSSTQTSSTSSSMAGQGSVSGQGSSFPFYAPQQSPQRSLHQSPKRATQPQPSPQHRSPQQPKTPVTSASPQRSAGQMGNPHQGSHRPQVNMPNFDLDLQNNSMGSQMPAAAAPHNDMTRSERDTGERLPNMSNISDSYTYGLNASSQPLNQRSGPPPREQPPLFPNITVSTHEGPLNMGINKSHSEMRSSHKRINEMNQRNVPPKSQTNERASSYSMQPFYATPNFSPSNPLETAPLRHPPLISGDDRPGVARSYDPIFQPTHSQSYNPVGQNFSNSRYDSNSVTQSFPPHDSSGTQPLSHTPPSQNMEGRKSANSTSNQNPKHSKSSRSQQMPPTSQTRAMNGPSQSRSGPTPPQVPPPTSHRPTPPQQQQTVPAAQSRPKSTSRSSKQSQKKKMTYGMESDLPPHPAMFDPSRSLTPAYLPIPTQALSPPTRNMQNEGPSLFGPGNLFGSSSRKSAGGPQNSDLSTPFNSLFPPTRPQNGLGFNFQPGFGMNSMHGPMSNSPQITPHSGSVTVTPHMSNFTFTNIFSDPNNSSQNDSLNISPIKFPPNPMLPHQSMDPNSLHHAHQQTSSLYHQHRTHPPSVIHNMNIPSILGHNHHGFDSRGMAQGINTSVAPPFPGHSHPSFGMPPLNFSMHDH